MPAAMIYSSVPKHPAAHCHSPTQARRQRWRTKADAAAAVDAGALGFSLRAAGPVRRGVVDRLAGQRPEGLDESADGDRGVDHAEQAKPDAER